MLDIRHCERDFAFMPLINKILLGSLFSLTACLTSLFAADLESQVWGPVTNGFQMSISLASSNNAFKANERMPIIIQIRNLTTNVTGWDPIPFPIEAGHLFSFVVTSPSGKELVKRPNFYESERGDIRGIPSKGSERHQFNLNYTYLFDEIGTYTVVAMRKLWLWPYPYPYDSHKGPKADLFTVVSNPLSVTVVTNK